MNLPAYREDLTAQRLAWAEHAHLTREWNTHVKLRASHERVPTYWLSY
jgi:hypothetical protein